MQIEEGSEYDILEKWKEIFRYYRSLYLPTYVNNDPRHESLVLFEPRTYSIKTQAFADWIKRMCPLGGPLAID